MHAKSWYGPRGGKNRFQEESVGTGGMNQSQAEKSAMREVRVSVLGRLWIFCKCLKVNDGGIASGSAGPWAPLVAETEKSLPAVREA